MCSMAKCITRSMLILLCVLPAAGNALDTTVTLVADSSITATNSEVVTFGLPLVEGDVFNTSEIRVLIGGVEQVASIAAGLVWHWSDNSLRSVTIQLHGIDMSSGDVTVSIDDLNNSGTQAFVPHSTGWATGPDNKANKPFPRIFAVHDLDYLAGTGIVPPYVPGNLDEGIGKLQSDQFDNNFGDLDFRINGSLSQSSYLFDRATAMLKAYMNTGDTKFLKEGFMTKQLYFDHIRNDGTPPSDDFVIGGDGCFTFGDVGCSDGKYIYTQPAKLAWALFGDNSQWDNELINEMAIQADIGSWQPGTRDPYDEESEGFTERAAGIVGLAEIGAYEITGDATVLSHLNERIDVLKDMQQTVFPWETANSWPKSGAFTHSWAVHESGASAYPGDGTADDRRFSPWMSENIIDFLWQTYTVTGRADIPEMLRQVGNAIDLYGYTSSYQSGFGLDATYQTKTGLSTILMVCDAPDNVPVSLLYSASNVASAAALAATAGSDGNFADSHNVETVLGLSLAFYFETDEAVRTRLYSRIQHIEQQWLKNGSGDTEDCSTVFGGTYRLFNWQHRSNSMGTWGWVLNEVAGVFDTTPAAFNFDDQSDLDPVTDVTSNTITVAGLGSGATANVSADNGTLVINGIDCASDCSVQNGNTVAVRVTTAGTGFSSVAAKVTIGSKSDTFTATTGAITLSYSGWLWVNAISGGAGCQEGGFWHYQCQSTAQWVPAANLASHDLVATCNSFVGNVCLATVDSYRPWTAVSNLGVDTFLLNCTSEPADLTRHQSCTSVYARLIKSGSISSVDDYPDEFTFSALIDQDTSSEVTSNTITIGGLFPSLLAPVSTDMGTLVINDSDCSSACSVDNGDSLAVRITTSAAISTGVTAVVSVGAYSSSFTATTSATSGATPDAFSFSSLTDQASSTQVTSNTITVAGLGAGVEANVSVDTGTIIIDGADCAGICKIEDGETLAVRVTTSHLTGTLVTANVTVGTFTTAFNATTAGPTPDTTPDSFVFSPKTGLTPSTLITSDLITIAGLGAGVDANASTDTGVLFIEGVECVTDCRISNGETLAVRVTTSATSLDVVIATVMVGTFSTSFDATTGIVVAAAPTALVFNGVDNASLSQSYDSNAIQIDWLSTITSVTTTAGTLLINGTPCTVCTVDYGDMIAIRLISAGLNGVLTGATVTIGGISGDFNITTELGTSSGGIPVSDPNVLSGERTDITISLGQVITNQGLLINLINRGIVNGGTVGGNVNNSADAILNDISLAEGATITGGSLTGIIKGTGTVMNTRVDATSIDPTVVIGRGSKVTTKTITNVSDLKLTSALTDEQGKVQLDLPLIVAEDGKERSVIDVVKGAVDKLFGNEGTAFANGNDEGTLDISNPDIQGVLIPILPISVQTTSAPDSVTIANAHGELVIVSDGIKTTFIPAAADLVSFQAGINANGGSSEVLSDGSVSIEFDGSNFSLRFSPVARLANLEISSSEIAISALVLGEATFSQIGSESDPETYRLLVHYPDGTTQEVLPAIHDIAAFDSWLDAGGFAAIIDGRDGIISFQDVDLGPSEVVWRGIPSYLVIPSPDSAPGIVDFDSVSDLNGDGIGDLYFDSGDQRQVIYGLQLD